MDKARCFLILKMVWCLNVPSYCYFLHIFERCQILLTYNLKNVDKIKKNKIDIKFAAFKFQLKSCRQSNC